MQLETKHIPEILAALNRVLHQCVDAGLPYDPDRLSEACREFCKVICRESGKRF